MRRVTKETHRITAESTPRQTKDGTLKDFLYKQLLRLISLAQFVIFKYFMNKS